MITAMTRSVQERISIRDTNQLSRLIRRKISGCRDSCRCLVYSGVEVEKFEQMMMEKRKTMRVVPRLRGVV